MYDGRISKKKLKEIVYKTFANDVQTAIEHLLYHKFNLDFCRTQVTYKGLENLDKALKSGRGVVLLHGHTGNPHIIMPAIGGLGYKLHQLASRNPPEKYHGFLSGLVNLIRFRCYKKANYLKEKFPVNFIYIDSFLRAPFKALKRNEVLSAALDGREGNKSIDIRFLNHKAIFYTGVMRLILTAKPVVLPTFHVRNMDNTHTIIIEKPMSIEVSGDKEKDIILNIKKFVSILEKYVYEYPWLYANAFCLGDDVFFIT